MELGDRYLVVQRAAIGANAMKRDAMAPNYGVPGSMAMATPAVLAAAAGGQDGDRTRVLQMLNMVSPEELASDQDFEEIVEDIKEECGASLASTSSS